MITKADARVIASGLLADGLNFSSLSPAGRREIRSALELILKQVDAAAAARPKVTEEQIALALCSLPKCKERYGEACLECTAGARRVLALWGAAAEDFWHPMETAPRDGTIIDVWLGDADASDVEFYCGKGTRRSPSWHWLDGKWRPATGLISMPTFVVPTHWRPLPRAPGSGRKR